jgi:NarL family two-component system response regulator LiaR
MPSPSRPLRVAILNDYEIVVAGVASMLAPYRDRVEVVEVDGISLGPEIDIALFDMFAHVSGDGRMDLEHVIRADGPQVIIFSWLHDPAAVKHALSQGARAYLSKTLSPVELVQALEAIHSGAVPTSTGPHHLLGDNSEDSPVHEFGLSSREAEVLALIAKGMSNKEIAQTLFLSVNSIKTYIRTAYAKIGVHTRSQAVLWTVGNGFPPASLLRELDRDYGRERR